MRSKQRLVFALAILLSASIACSRNKNEPTLTAEEQALLILEESQLTSEEELHSFSESPNWLSENLELSHLSQQFLEDGSQSDETCVTLEEFTDAADANLQHEVTATMVEPTFSCTTRFAAITIPVEAEEKAQSLSESGAFLNFVGRLQVRERSIFTHASMPNARLEVMPMDHDFGTLVAVYYSQPDTITGTAYVFKRVDAENVFQMQWSKKGLAFEQALEIDTYIELYGNGQMTPDEAMQTMAMK